MSEKKSQKEGGRKSWEMGKLGEGKIGDVYYLYIPVIIPRLFVLLLLSLFRSFFCSCSFSASFPHSFPSSSFCSVAFCS